MRVTQNFEELTKQKSKLQEKIEEHLQKGVFGLDSLLKQEKVNQYIIMNSTLHFISENSVIPKVHLINEFFVPVSRRNDVLSVLQYNLLNPFITKIHLYQEKHYDFSKFINHEKIVSIIYNKRLTAGEAFRYATKNLNNEIVVLSNNDIYFDNTLLHIREMKPKELYTISRQNTIKGRKINVKDNSSGSFWNLCTIYLGSHDVFAVKTPVEDELLAQLDNCPLGMWESENAINQLFFEANWKLKNPCSRILVRHLHSYRTKSQDSNKKHQGLQGKYGIEYPEPHGFEKMVPYEIDRRKWKQFFKKWGRNNLKKQQI